MEQLKDNIVGIVDHYLRFHDLMTGEEAADKILSLISKTESGAQVPCSGGLDAPYELARLVEACRQLITAAGYDAGNVPKARAPWKVLCNAINYYGDKGI